MLCSPFHVTDCLCLTKPPRPSLFLYDTTSAYSISHEISPHKSHLSIIPLSDHTHLSVSTISPKPLTPTPMDIPVRITDEYRSYSNAIKNKNVIVRGPVMMNDTPIPLKHYKPQKLQMALLNIRSLSDKTFLVKDIIVERRLIVCFLSETWLNSDAPAVFIETAPSNFDFYSCRLEKKGRGVCYYCFSGLRVSTTCSELVIWGPQANAI